MIDVSPRNTLTFVSAAMLLAGIAVSAVFFWAWELGLGDAARGPFEWLGLAMGAGIIVLAASVNLPVPSGYFCHPAMGRRRLFSFSLSVVPIASAVTAGAALMIPVDLLPPRIILVFVTLPVIAAGVSLVVLLAPALVWINLLVVLGLLGLSEGVAYLALRLDGGSGLQAPGKIKTKTAKGPRVQTGSYTSDYFVFDESLGYKVRPDRKATSVLKRGDTVVYDATYTIDEHGRRHTPGTGSIKEKDRFIAVFGGSFAFGEGVNDDQTTPYFIAASAPGYQPVNFALHGYGPQQMLAILESADIEKTIPQRSGIAIYIINSGHLARLRGSMVVHNKWGHHMPFYELDGEGQPVRNGNFTSGRPFLAMVLPLLSNSNLVRYFKYNPLGKETPEGNLLLAKIFQKACRLFGQRFRSEGCYVVLYPGKSKSLMRQADLIREAGVGILDYSGLFDPTLPAYAIPGDGHPSAKAHQIIGTRIAKDLGLGQP